MNIPTYTSTIGLDRYPEQDRFSVYRSIHKRLMREDAGYRRQWVGYGVAIVCIAIIPSAGLMIDGIAGILFSVLSILGVIPAVFYLAWRQQRFMNQKIGNVLRV